MDAWKEHWARGIKTSMINPCLRADWKLQDCTAQHREIYTLLQLYASSRPAGAPEFQCHFRRLTGANETFKKGDVITSWKQMLLSASPPTARPDCIPANTGDGEAIKGKCFVVTVPENSSYVVLEPNFEMLFPVGCVFTVIKDENAAMPIQLLLDQSNVTTEIFPPKPENVTDNSWFDGVLQLMARATIPLWDKTTNLTDMRIKTPKGHSWRFFEPHQPPTRPPQVTKDVPANIAQLRGDFHNSTIIIPSAMDSTDFCKDLEEEMAIICTWELYLQTEMGREYSRNAFAASGGLPPTVRYKLSVSSPTYTDTCMCAEKYSCKRK
jgi:hypothetical protein